MPKKKQLWSSRFSEAVDPAVRKFTSSLSFDKRLALYDIQGSLAHARMLGACAILTRRDVAAIERGLARVRREIETGRFEWSPDDEDVHVAIERHATLIMPGYTHLQVAQPVTFGHHLLAYVAMLERDYERLAECRRRVNRLPLGAAALAGTGFAIDRERVARELGFDGVAENSLDAVSDRDFAIEFCACASLVMVHLSRLAEELVLWASPRFGFVRLPDRYCTGSSIMPQKKNPDVPELVRGKSGRVFGSLVALLAIMKGQPLAYNKDNQEDKEPLFDAAATVKSSLGVFAGLIADLVPVPRAMRAAALEGHATATDLADYLVRKGVPFRDAHEAVARAVREAERAGVDLAQLPFSKLRSFSPKIGRDVKGILTLEGSVAARNHIGGTAPAQVRQAIARARSRLPRARKRLAKSK